VDGEAAAPRSPVDQRDPHRRSSWIVDALLGGQDGLVNVLGVVLGVATAAGEARIVLVAGLAAAMAECVSMGAVAYTSRIAAGELYESERERERRHIRLRGDLEREEIRELFARMGFEGELLELVVAKITSNPEIWIDVMMALEHQLGRVGRRSALRSALLVGFASLVGSLPPLAPFLFLRVDVAGWAATVLSAAILFAFGAYKGKATVGRPFRGGLELAAIGTTSALIGYAVGLAFRVPG
jgi:VIT1/CCC1 family predicted Fe2+/Mn2+ transporter